MDSLPNYLSYGVPLACASRTQGALLLTTILDRAYRFSSTWFYSWDECERLKSLFSRLKYPQHLINPTMNTFVSLTVADRQPSQASAEMTSCDVTRVVITFKDQESANLVKTQLKDVSLKLHTKIQPVFVSKKFWPGTPRMCDETTSG